MSKRAKEEKVTYLISLCIHRDVRRHPHEKPKSHPSELLPHGVLCVLQLHRRDSVVVVFET